MTKNTMKQTEEQETELSVLKEILRWMKISGMKQVKSLLAETLPDETKRIVYQLSDGTRGITELMKLSGIKSTATIYKMWKQWMLIGIGEAISVSGGQRFSRFFSLDDFGIDVNLPSNYDENKRLPEQKVAKDQQGRLEEIKGVQSE